MNDEGRARGAGDTDREAVEPTPVRCAILIRVLIDTTCDVDDLGRLAQEAGYHIANNLRVIQRPGDQAKQFSLDVGFSIQCRHDLDHPGMEQARKDLEEIMRLSEVAALERLYRKGVPDDEDMEDTENTEYEQAEDNDDDDDMEDS